MLSKLKIYTIRQYRYNQSKTIDKMCRYTLLVYSFINCGISKTEFTCLSVVDSLVRIINNLSTMEFAERMLKKYGWDAGK